MGGSASRGSGPSVDPTSGGLAGLAKTAGHEWPGVDCKAVDLGDGDRAGRNGPPAWIVEELLARGPAEVGLDREGRVTLEVVPGPRARPRSGTKAAARVGRPGRDQRRGARDHRRGRRRPGREFRPRLLVLGRSPAPEGDEEDGLAACRDEAELKRYLLRGPDRRRSPQAIGERVRRIMAEREIRRNLARIAAAGSRVVYRSVDVRDRAAVRDAIDQARDEHRPGPRV